MVSYMYLNLKNEALRKILIGESLRFQEMSVSGATAYAAKMGYESIGEYITALQGALDSLRKE